MKRIYYRSLDGTSGTVYAENEPYKNAAETTYTLFDIMGRKYIFPVNMTLFEIWDWDGNTDNVIDFYKDALIEYLGTSTGTLKKIKK